jgi:hypothetical protein
MPIRGQQILYLKYIASENYFITKIRVLSDNIIVIIIRYNILVNLLFVFIIFKKFISSVR